MKLIDIINSQVHKARWWSECCIERSLCTKKTLNRIHPKIIRDKTNSHENVNENENVFPKATAVNLIGEYEFIFLKSWQNRAISESPRARGPVCFRLTRAPRERALIGVSRDTAES